MSQKKQNTQNDEGTREAIRFLYDSFMFKVEPDLVSAMVPELEGIYAGESEEDRRKRMARYADAFAMFMAFIEDATVNAEKSFLGIKKEAFAAYAKQTSDADANVITSLEKDMNDNTAPNAS